MLEAEQEVCEEALAEGDPSDLAAASATLRGVRERLQEKVQTLETK